VGPKGHKFQTVKHTRTDDLPFTCRGRPRQNASSNLTGSPILNKGNLGWSVYYHLPGKQHLSLRPLLFPMQLSSRTSGREKLCKSPQHTILWTRTYLVSLLTSETSPLHHSAHRFAAPRCRAPAPGSWAQPRGSRRGSAGRRVSSARHCTRDHKPPRSTLQARGALAKSGLLPGRVLRHLSWCRRRGRKGWD